jgi:dihydroorotase
MEGSMPRTSIEIPDYAQIESSVDTHAHLRNCLADGDGRMEMNIRRIVNHHGVVFHIGNGAPAILDQTSADQELAKARSCLEPWEKLDIYAVPLIRDDTTPDMIIETRIARPRNVRSWKAFLSGVSNDGGNSVSDFAKLDATLRAFYEPVADTDEVILDIHAERKFDRQGRRIPMEDREWYAIKTDVAELLDRHPKLSVTIKHVSDARTLRQIVHWRVHGRKVYAEICPHYLFRCHEDLYEGPGGGTAFNLHDLCWPLYKSAGSMQALRKAVLSGADWIMMGLDYACHNNDPTQSSKVKVNDEGIVVGGVTILPAVAKCLVIDLFAEAGRLDRINGYISRNARRVYGLPPASKIDRYDRMPWQVPLEITGDGPNGSTLRAKPFMRGQTMNWKIYVPSEL